ncbi:MAG: hydrogenase iron-sulfur subunit [Desulfobacteraceae bacterium]|jgi:coenzyme F420-reducing hydrogenase delta subunit|nr:MAG: hydrogenase iron-sulfur subunit [Desulfobacteraceae bacterium]
MNAKKKMEYLKTLLPNVNIDPARIEMYNLSAAMGPRWAEICTEFTEKIKKLGPSPIWLAENKFTGKE